MKKTAIYFLLFATLMLPVACDNGNKNKDAKEEAKDANDEKFDDTKIEGDTKFAVDAADCGMLEVKLGELAATNASSQQVKDLGKMMTDEHKKANDELMALAQKKNITLPAELSENSMEKYNKLKDKKGYEFDKDYTDMMVDEHQKDIDKFEKEADKGDDADLKAWAAGKVPVLKEHLKHAITTRDLVKNTKKDDKMNHKEKEKY